MAASLPYDEPTIVTILVHASFLLLLNVVNFLLDHSVYCGLLGQIFVGVAWGTPGAKWLAESVEHVVVQLGYLGLILLVFEGGLSTSFSSLKANLLLSIAVAITGISVPIGLSFVLQQLLGATPLQAFSAGAALCSTSLGTTFTVLSTSGLTKSRLGVVLTSAAMMDDVVGLVMVQVISNLGGSSSSFNSTTVIRPVFVSIAFGILVPLACWLIVRPGTLYVNRLRESNSSSTFNKLVSLERVVFLIHTLILVAMVAGGSYAGTSNLFTAYLAGACISWWDTELPHAQISKHKASGQQPEGTHNRPSVKYTGSTDNNGLGSQRPVSNDTSGFVIYEEYYQQPVERILKPLFFASIGFSIPISHMFTGSIIWRGIVYTIPMLFGKLVCGIWLIRFSISPYIPEKLKSRRRIPQIPHLWGSAKNAESKKDKKTTDAEPINKKKATLQKGQQALASQSNNQTASTTHELSSASESHAQRSAASPPSHTSAGPKKPLSLYPASILGSAMVARGEIGFLISSLAESKGIFSSSSSSSGDSEIYLVVTWAIMLCTIIGPLGVGMLVRRVKKLEKRGSEGVEGRKDVLGVWGVE
ncbi:uncharacterized protein K452DRAFT_357919 [Aplosporella prunicola CBS 121167]|uniref:Cation/H+ exchanger transmembrane domain-containing protein n=1 Tax=Aplosporella prunicola CBS 121167 TaxID=1176127 RepID=A0A6A6BGW5_9PEZI|nr:uncharacterized protein K452DRAFT_357919 [Aplosporella prunicola CBS 121167]KAF2142848.1 hypothetical protein K452DRAFT_357919 [Aplosporella prunicola CBS 121167]